MTDFNFITEIPANEQLSFDKFIQDARKKHIVSPKETVSIVLSEQHDLMNSLTASHDVSQVIRDLREEAYKSFLKQEAQMNAYILKHLAEKFAFPRSQFSQLLTLFEHDEGSLETKLQHFFGDFSGLVYPYIYRLSLSNTQSRRSRAGKVFEGIIYGLYEALGYPFESQASVGSNNFKSKKLGKIVDSLLPSLESFEMRRDKVILGTMKTTLRERWQEVVEEINRTGLPRIYLLTVDEDISESKVEQMANHNVILVVYSEVKATLALRNKMNVVSFEDYFFDEIPQALSYWERAR